MDEDERTRLKAFFSLVENPCFACNLKEEEIADLGTNPFSTPKSGRTVNGLLLHW